MKERCEETETRREPHGSHDNLRVFRASRPQYVPVAKVEELPAGGRKLVTVDECEIALFNVEGRVYAIRNRCPHRNGPLIRGDIDGLRIRCPMHGWSFDLRTGRSRQPASAVTYGVVRAGDWLYLLL